ncbi:MAG: hypothetical protein ABIP51_15235 [Bacteroidia bacterium]
MKKISKLLLVGMSILALNSCGNQPQYVQQPVVVQQQPVYTAGADYQVIQDPSTGIQNVVYTMNGLQYIIAYSTFMNWYGQGGYGYVNQMYNSNRSYFNTYTPSRYRSWKTSTFRDTYHPKNYNYRGGNSSTTQYQRPSQTQSYTPQQRPTSFGKTSRPSTPSSFSRPTTRTTFTPSSSSSSTKSSFGRRH